jgi:hypothetical protein
MMTHLRPTLRALALLTAAALTPVVAHAQQQQGATQPAGAAATTAAAPINTAAEQVLKQIRSRLNAVLAAQEANYSDNGTYTTSLTALAKYDPSLSVISANKRRDSVSVQVIFAGGRGWTGVASHWGLRGKSCVVYVGSPEELPKLPFTRADRRTPTEEGVPVCDAAPPLSAPPAPAPAPAQPASAAPPARNH